MSRNSDKANDFVYYSPEKAVEALSDAFDDYDRLKRVIEFDELLPAADERNYIDVAVEALVAVGYAQRVVELKRLPPTTSHILKDGPVQRLVDYIRDLEKRLEQCSKG